MDNIEEFYLLNTRVTVLEEKEKQKNENVNERFRNIENNLNYINKTLSQISLEVTSFIAASKARHKLWLFIFSLAGAVGGISALGLHTIIFKFFGVNV